jgi:hypothetical protein
MTIAPSHRGHAAHSPYRARTDDATHGTESASKGIHPGYREIAFQRLHQEIDERRQHTLFHCHDLVLFVLLCWDPRCFKQHRRSPVELVKVLRIDCDFASQRTCFAKWGVYLPLDICNTVMPKHVTLSTASESAAFPQATLLTGIREPS